MGFLHQHLHQRQFRLHQHQFRVLREFRVLLSADVGAAVEAKVTKGVATPEQKKNHKVKNNYFLY